MPASPSCWAMTSSNRSARSSSASTCRPTCRPIARCDSCHCEAQGDKAIQLPSVMLLDASRSLSSGARSRDPLARNGVSGYFVRTRTSRLRQRGLQILDQIVAVFEAGRESDETLADPEFGARLRRQPLVGGSGRMGDEALGVAEIVRNPRDLQRVETTERHRLTAFDLEADQRRSGAHLLLHQGGLWVIGAAGIDQPREFRMMLQR